MDLLLLSLNHGFPIVDIFLDHGSDNHPITTLDICPGCLLRRISISVLLAHLSNPPLLFKQLHVLLETVLHALVASEVLIGHDTLAPAKPVGSDLIHTFLALLGLSKRLVLRLLIEH